MANNINSIYESAKANIPPTFNQPHQPIQALPQNPIVQRYRDSYRVAKTLNTFGMLAKILGLFGGGGIIFVSLIAGMGIIEKANRSSFGSGGETAVGVVFLVIGIIAGLLAGAIFFVLGVVISALGQNLFATLDTAVHTSPFLDNTQKGQAMS